MPRPIGVTQSIFSARRSPGCWLLIAGLLAGSARGEVRNPDVVPGLSAAVEIELDRHAIPTIEAANLDDAHAALGWLHGRNRFFQMDMSRRRAAGELAAIGGPNLLAIDQPNAVARRRELADRIVAGLSLEEQRLLKSYARGVNAGVASLEAPPVEYTLLRTNPTDWVPADSILVMLSMFDLLQNSAEREPPTLALRNRVDPAVAAWMCSVPGRWDTLLIQSSAMEFTPPFPPEFKDRKEVRGEATAGWRQVAAKIDEAPDLHPGSNSFAVAGDRTPDGRAIVANDPHLASMAPGIWYRARLKWPKVDATGLTLPGVPGLPIGVTDHLAWGLTNTTGDFEDLVVIEIDPNDPDRYRVEGGFERFDDKTVEIAVAGNPPRPVTSRFTRWGPVVETLPDGRPLALLRACDQVGAVNLAVVGLCTATDLETGLEAAATWGGPSQNVLIATADGRIGWTLSGMLPDRRGYDGLSPVSHLEGRGWFGALAEDIRPRVIDPPSGRLVTANNRLIPLATADRIGKVWADGGRAWRIRADMDRLARTTELDLLAIQLDETVQRFLPFRDLLIESLEGLEIDLPGSTETLALVRAWDGRASASDTATPVVEVFRATLIADVKALLLERFAPAPAMMDAAEIDARAIAASAIGAPTVLAAIEGRDERLIPRDQVGDSASWDGILQNAARAAIQSRLDDPETPWAERNRNLAAHPLGRMDPRIGNRFDLPSVPQPGHWGAVRVQARRFGASARFVASPGHLDDGLLTTPGGQSGDPGSPWFADLHSAWATGAPSPLAPGAPVERRRLVGVTE